MIQTNKFFNQNNISSHKNIDIVKPKLITSIFSNNEKFVEHIVDFSNDKKNPKMKPLDLGNLKNSSLYKRREKYRLEKFKKEKHCKND